MKMRRMFAALLVAALLLSVLPVVGFGITTNDVDTKGQTTGTYDNNELYLGKTATLEDDGTYTIRLEAFATGNPVTTQVRTGKPLDIVLVLDQSGSMFRDNYLEALRESVNEFIGVIAANGRTIGVTHRVAIVGFASDIDDGSSMNAENTDHQLAGGSDNVYTNTGVFLKDGTFKNYGAVTESYIEFDGTPVEDGIYYIRDNDNIDENSDVDYFPLTAGTGYAVVVDPATDRTDLFAQYNNGYVSAHYLRSGYFEVAQDNMQTDGTYYIDVDGVKTELSYITVTTGETEYQYTKADSIATQAGTNYYIDTDGDGVYETELTFSKHNAPGLFQDGSVEYTGSDGNTYTATYSWLGGTPTTFGDYEPYIRSAESEPVTESGWSVDGTTLLDLTGKTVYQYNEAGWYYTANGVENKTDTVYEAGALIWTYDDATYDPATTQFFVTGTTGGLSNDDYRDALMPVTKGEAGTGDITDALNTAVSKIASSGATRTSLGMEMAKNILANRTSLGDDDNRETVVVVFTDGTPGFSSFENTEANAALAAASTIKKGGADIYTIGLYSSATDNVTNFMNYLSSNYGAVENMDRQVYTYAEAETVSTPSFGQSNTRTTNYYALHEGTYYQVSVKRSGSFNVRVYSWYYTDSTGETHEICNEQAYNGTETLYTRTGTTATAQDDGYYLYISEKDKLRDIFSEIITESTTTVLGTEELKANTILRDILQTGFVFTDGTTVTMSSLSGTWDNGKITWGATETLIESVTVTDPNAEKTTSANGKISVYNQGEILSVEATGFDYNTNFFPQEGTNTGAKLIVTITRVEATDAVAWNQTELTNDPDSGVWSAPVNGTSVQIGVFPQPTTYFTDTVMVMDYAKTTEDLAALIRQDGAEHLDIDGMNYFSTAVESVKDGYGNANITNGELTYTPNTMKWDGYDSFYVFGDTTDSKIVGSTANANGNVWSKVTVIPANNVYYEDTFVTNESTGTVGIEFTGLWEQVSAGSNTEAPENGENTEGDNQGGVHGWEDSLADDTGYSDGTAAVGGANATATFTFTGTGVDIYSRTNMQTGLIMASLYAGEEATGVPLRTLVIDNFAHSGDYYMIPTLSIHELMARGDDGAPIKDADGNYTFEAMEYGTYTVKLTVIAINNDPDLDGTSTVRSTYYLDGIRVYNPIEADDTVAGAYGDSEINAVFTEVRDILLDANSFGEDAGVGGVVFIDQILNTDDAGNVTEGDVPGTTTDIGVYEDLGPESEVYLKDGQLIAFAPEVEGEYADAKYYVGLKSPTGKPVTFQIYKDGNVEFITISHTTDMYYDVTPESGIVVISNVSENEEGEYSLLAITKIKIAGPRPEVATFAMFRAVSREEVLTAANEAYAAANEPETPDVEIENPEVEAPEVDEPAPETEPNLPELLSKLVKRIFGNLWDWFH